MGKFVDLTILNSIQLESKKNIKFSLAKIMWCIILLLVTYFFSQFISNVYVQQVIIFFNSAVIIATMMYVMYCVTNILNLLIQKFCGIKQESIIAAIISKIVKVFIDLFTLFFTYGFFQLIIIGFFCHFLADFGIALSTVGGQFQIFINDSGDFVIDEDTLLGFAFLVSSGAILLGAIFMFVSNLVTAWSFSLIDDLKLLIIGTGNKV